MECGASKRHACQLVHQPHGTQRYQPTQRDDEDALTRAIIALASQYGRYEYRRITIKLQEMGWNVSKDRVERISTPRTKTSPRGPRHLATRRAEGAAEAEATRPIMAQRRFLRAAAAGAAESRLVL
jgi:hypothetical protein